MCVEGVGGGGGVGVWWANVHTKNKLLGANVRGACSAGGGGGGVKCPFLLIFIEGQMSWRGGANFRRPMAALITIVLDKLRPSKPLTSTQLHSFRQLPTAALLESAVRRIFFHGKICQT